MNKRGESWYAVGGESGEPADVDVQLLLSLAVRRRERPAPERLEARRRSMRLRDLLLVADGLALMLAVGLVELALVRFQTEDIGILALAVPGLAGWAFLAKLYGLYDRDERGSGRSVLDDLPDLLLLSTLATWLGTLILNTADIAHPRLRNAAVFWVSYLVFLAAARALARWLAHGPLGLRTPTLIVGAGRVGRLIGAKLAARRHPHLDIVGFLDDDPLDGGDGACKPLGGFADLERIVRAYRVERVIIAFSRLSTEDQLDLCRRCLDLGVQVDIVPRMFEVIGWRNQFHNVDGIPLVALHTPTLLPAARLSKRALDVVLSLAGLVILAPLFAFVAWRIKTESPGPIFFRQERVGAGGRRFTIFKFRTMYVDADERKHEVAHLNKHRKRDPRMFKVPHDPRVTPFGRFLRRWSLDELPQLINVLRGEMSLVGPRPLILDEDENVLGRHRQRLRLTPGITGLWQVLGRSDIPFSEMVTLDYLYVTNWSLWEDIKLLSRTVPAVLHRRGAY